MRFATGFAAALVLAAATTTVTAATPTRLSDAQFVAANRCLGLLTSKAIGTPDAGTLGKLVKQQSWGRDAFIYEKADQARDDARMDASRDSADLHAKLIAERDGVCRAFLDTNTAGGAGAGHSS